MLIETKHFGKIEIDENEIIEFEESIPGFPDVHRYVLLGENDQNSPFLWLQAVNTLEPSFVVTQPKIFKPEYSPRLTSEVIESLDIKDLNKILFYSIVVVPEDITQLRTNLQAPIVINTENNKAKQVVLNQPEYKLRHYIMEEIKKKGGGENASAHQKAK